ncbi:MAG: ATP-binding protein [Phormidesmis sp.]
MPLLSLQTHLVSSQPQLPAISVDPRGFKAAIQSLVDFLIAHQIPATLWLKLPKDDAWWTDIWQYGQQARGCTLYTLGDQTGHPPDNLAASLCQIPVEQDGEFKREYLCMAVADNFVSLLLAARPASAVDKRSLKLYGSTSGKAVAALSTDVRQIIEASLPAAPAEDNSLSESVSESVSESASNSDAEADAASQNGSETSLEPAPAVLKSSLAAQAVLSQWDHCFPAALLSCESLPLSDAFLAWQLQSQADMRSQLATYRSTAKTVGGVSYSLSPDFLSQASQELQAPLTTIKTALTLLGSPALKLVQRQRYLEMISAQCDRQKALITSVIDLLQVQTSAIAPPQALQLADMIPGIVSTYQPIAEEKGIMLAYTVPPTLPEISSSESELKQIAIHLINNGIHITPKGGRVWVAAMPHNPNFVALTVQDSGAGIAKSDIARLFDAFHRRPGSDNTGAGLGLTLVQQLVKRMGGSIAVDSAPDQGTVFKVLLPVHYPAKGTVQKPENVAATTPNVHATSNGHSSLSRPGKVNALRRS